MKTHIPLLWLAACILVSTVPPLRAQLVADAATRTLSNVTNALPGTVTVGTNGAFTLLTLADNALLTNSAHGVIGRNATAKSNEVQLLSPSARWRMGGDLSVGSNGAMSRFVVSNGALAENFIGSLATGVQSSNNFALVTGSGSLWSNRSDVIVGWFGRNNQIVVSNGGRVINVAGGTIGSQVSAPGNVATVTGNGSIWNAGSALTVGYLGANNRLVIEAGGRVDCGTGRVGYNTGSNNLALVTGAGSVWSNVNLEIGGFGPNNQLIVSNGASVVAAVDGFLGHDPGASNNVAVVTGLGSLWTNQFDLLVGYQEGRNQLVVSNGGLVVNRIGHLGYFSIANNNAAVVTGAGSVWSNRLSLNVGLDGSGNRLVVVDGGTVAANNLNVGATSLSLNNRVTVNGGTLRARDGAGTGTLDVRRGTNVLNAGLIEVDVLLLTNNLGRFEFNGGTLVTRGAVISNSANFIVGRTGSVPAVWDVRAGTQHVAGSTFVGFDASFAQLIHTNGAFLTNSDVAYLGVNAVSRSNRATLAGPASRWWLRHGVVVGDFGSDNRLTVSDGTSLVTADRNFIGIGPNSTNNEALVAGPGSSWTGGPNGILQLGSAGQGNRLIVAAAGQVSHGVGILGVSPSASNNLALITGPGSLWNILDELRVGGSAQGNQLVVSNGAAVFTGGLAMLGADTNASRNSVLVTDPGSSWLINSNLFVGSNGALCQLVISNGALVASAGSVLGGSAISSNNLAVVTGPGTEWNSGESLHVGRAGGGNRLLATDGARVASEFAIVGNTATSSGNTVVVRGTGTLWTNTDTLIVGRSGSGNRLTVDEGARLESTLGTIGDDATGSRNELVVSGPGSWWNNADRIFVGSSGGGSQLVVSNGGRVTSTVTSLGVSSSARSNQVVVTGSGSVWSNASSLAIGESGSGNRLVVSDGGVVGNLAGFVGLTASSSNNAILVTGPGSEWRTTFNLSLGQSGAGNLLVVSNGGVAFAGNGLFLGFASGSTNNRVVVEGGTLRSTNSQGTSAYDIRHGTNLLNAGWVEADRLLLTNAQGFFEFNGGTLAIENSSLNNGQSFRVGNGVSPATLKLKGDGLHAFGSGGVIVSSNGVLTGSGTASGALAIQAGGLLSPGDGIGRLSLTRIIPPTLLGATLMEISKSGSALTNDVLQVPSVVLYGGSLIVSNAGPDALAQGDRFRLFHANGYSGSFSSLSLPALPDGLAWINKLPVDGSIEIGGPPRFASIGLSGTNVILTGTNGPPGATYTVLTATNVTLPASNWVSLVTNQFGAGGVFSFTNGIDPGDTQRFFRLRTP